MHRSLTTLTTSDTGRPVLAVPLGSCEQHGPHLPLGTDTMIAEALAGRLAEVSADVVVAPSISIGASGEHQAFPGTLSIGTSALQTVIVELVRSADWAAGVVLVNGHGGNAAAVAAATAALVSEGRRVVSWWPPVDAAAAQIGIDPDAHAGIVETSILLSLRSDLVVRDRIDVGNFASIEDLMPDLTAGRLRDVSPTGVLGDPRGATLEFGAQLLDRFTTDLVATLRRAAADWNLASL